MQDNENKEAEISGEEMLCAILYLENSYKARFYYLKKRVKSYYLLNKAEYLRAVTAVQILLLNYQHDYNSNGKS